MIPANQIGFITDEHGERQSVVIPVSAYEEILEDIKDLAAIAERKTEDTISLDQLKKNYDICELEIQRVRHRKDAYE